MKMSKESFNKLKTAIDNKIKGTDYAERYQAAELSHKRFRWDCFWSVNTNNALGLGPLDHGGHLDLNDSHIDTALRAIVGSEYSKEVKPC